MALIVPARLGRQGGLPVAPPDLDEELKLYARESGRTAKFHFVPFGGWMARFEVRQNDPRLRLVQESKIKSVSEDVWFNTPNPYHGQVCDVASKVDVRSMPIIREMCFGMKRQGPYLPLDIIQLGRSGIRDFLDKGNSWSGRGQYGSVEEAVRKMREQNEQLKKSVYEKARIDNRLEQREKRRWFQRLPVVGVLADLKGKRKGA